MLYIMRHGKTDWNEVHKLPGRTDVPLNDEGREMAKAAGKACQDVHFDVCYCSPLIRARETAALVLKDRDVPIIYDERLVEMSFGVYEGLANSFQIPDCPVNVLFKKPEQYKAVEGGESFAELFSRTGAFLEERVYPALAENKDVLIIGHGAMNSSIVCHVKQIPLERFWEAGIENCKLMRLL
jgi:probable phosphoglycerate mutase